MGILVEEVKMWNTPVVGAYLLWSFTKAYRTYHPEGEAPVGILHFIAYALLTDQRLTKRISGNRPNLQSYVRGFQEKGEVDLLVGVHQEVISRRANAMDAIDIAVARGLLVWDVDSGRIYARESLPRAKKGRAMSEYARKLGKKAEILGQWFSQHDALTVASYLKVVL
ncbi:MAG: hypothetical protein DRR06_00620 [Gammaproteobacteria bacterium]|nr:MAG: hypothetical protein DRR06_00620 [Gammaproteobacteria bacterium]RLA52632.1 MAG: hypothetical protein DRR42_07045 [Gammaproteobacteria bacterium]